MNQNNISLLFFSCFFILGCGRGKEKTFSFNIRMTNSSNVLLNILYGFSASTGCHGAIEDTISSNETKDFVYSKECLEDPDHQSISIRDTEGNKIAGYQFSSNTFEIECDNEKCINTEGDFAGTDGAIKTYPNLIN